MAILWYSHFAFRRTYMVKDVFKTLLKVPCYIVIGYLIMNIVLFLGYYVKALGLSYSVMKVAVENNYIPQNEENILTDTMKSIGSQATNNQGMNISAVDNFGMYIDTSGSASDSTLYTQVPSFKSAYTRMTANSDNTRRQYGHSIVVGVGYLYTPVLPLPQSAYLRYNDQQYNYNSEYTDKVHASADIINYSNIPMISTPVRITYKVPGLKYYPDL